jgi:cell division protein FtsI/penicillin-binding protein 2
MPSQTLLRGWRIWAVLLTLAAFGGYIALNLFKVQVLENQAMTGKVEANITSTEQVQPNRGQIYDAGGYLLAGNAVAEDLYLDKNHKSDTELRTITDLLAPIIEEAPDELYERVIAVPGISPILLHRRLDPDAANRVRQLRERSLIRSSVWLDPGARREYPNGTEAAQILGFADYDNRGQYGIEEFYNDQLAGSPGEVTAERDSAGYVLPVGDAHTKPAIDGSDLTLTIDNAVQFMAEQELERSIREYQAKDGLILVMDPHTGALLAEAAWPNFNPNDFTHVEDWGLFKNPAISNQMEPGSTFKIMTYAASIDAGAVTPDTTFNCTGTIMVYGWPISNSDQVPHGTESMTQGFGRSCNIAADFAATQLGEAGFYKYIQAFGIGQPTGIDMAGEVPGTLYLPGDANYSPINLYTNAFGQGVAVTPLQMITAASAVANGGKLMKPYVVSRISRNGKVIQQNEPTVVRQVIQPGTAAQVRDMMVAAVEDGIGKLGSVPGYRVAAKTGTAQVPGTAGYNGAGTLASVMAFMPAYDPQFIIYILLNRPLASQWGATTASPTMARLGAQLLQYYKIPPTEPIPPTPQP